MAQADAAEEGISGASGEGDEEDSMSFTTEDIIRPEAGFLLRGDYRGKFLCSKAPSLRRPLTHVQ